MLAGGEELVSVHEKGAKRSNDRVGGKKLSTYSNQAATLVLISASSGISLNRRQARAQ